MQHTEFLTRRPRIDRAAFIASSADIVGDVALGEDSSIWYQTVLRGDIQSIVVGRGSNVQDGTVVHLSSDLGVEIGDWVTIGHRAIIHACTIKDEVLVGMGAIIMDGAVVGERSLIGAGALITKGFEVPPGSLVMGSPARVVRALSEDEQNGLRSSAEKYVQVARHFRSMQDAGDLTER